MEYYAIDIDMLNIECYNAAGGEPAVATAIEYMLTRHRSPSNTRRGCRCLPATCLDWDRPPCCNLSQ